MKSTMGAQPRQPCAIRQFTRTFRTHYSAAMDAIRVQHLTKRYDQTLAVDDTSFAVPAGATVGLLGGNGAGKTTTIAMLWACSSPRPAPWSLATTWRATASPRWRGWISPPPTCPCRSGCRWRRT